MLALQSQNLKPETRNLKYPFMSKVKLSIFLAILFTCCNYGVSAQRGKKTIVRPKPLIVTVRAPPPIDAGFTPAQKRRYESFMKVWSTLDENYFDQTFSGLNWGDIQREFQPRVIAAKTDGELHQLLQEMISRLHRSHLAIIPPEVFTAIETAKTAARAKEKELKEKSNAADDKTVGDEQDRTADDDFDENARYGIGIDLRIINDEFVITRVEKDSAGETAGLKTGYILNKINDVSLKELLAKILLYNPNVKNVRKTIPIEIISYFLNGEKDGIVNLEYADAANAPQQVKIKRQKLNGTTISIGKNYPEQFLRFEKTLLSDDVGYIKFNLFALPIIKDFCDSISEFKNKKAIVIDLRGNFGGVLATMTGLGGMLTDNRIDLGTSFYKTGSENLTAFTKAKNYKGRIVVLVDNLTISAAEIFAAALQENNRALVVGEKTAGEALPSLSVQLPTGAVMQYPIANFKTHDGSLVEGNGVTPDFNIILDRNSLLENTDNQLAAALKLIADDKAFPVKETAQKKAAPEDKTSAMPLPEPPPSAKLSPPNALKLNAAPKNSNEIFGKDEKSLQIIDEFIKLVGGEENLRKINNYHLKGATTIAVRGTNTDAQLDIYLQKPDKFAQYYHSDVIGEVREVYSGKNTFLQTDFGMDGDVPNTTEISQIETLFPIYNLLDKNYFSAFKYLGSFDRNGKKLAVIQAKTAAGATVGLAFDTATKTLASYVGSGSIFLMSDYQTVGSVRLPFTLERENILKINVESYELNKPINPAIFVKKENCFDKID